jgi:hypothetical protein
MMMIVADTNTSPGGERRINERFRRFVRTQFTAVQHLLVRLNEVPTAHVSSIPQGRTVWGVEDHRDWGKDSGTVEHASETSCRLLLHKKDRSSHILQHSLVHRLGTGTNTFASLLLLTLIILYHQSSNSLIRLETFGQQQSSWIMTSSQSTIMLSKLSMMQSTLKRRWLKRTRPVPLRLRISNTT